MLTDQDFSELTEDLRSEDLSLRVATLKAFRKLPSGDPRILPHLERLLQDKTPCVLGYPYIFGEVRWLAAHALAAERAALGINQPVRVQNVVKPINTAGIAYAEEVANVEFKGGVEGVLENLAILREMGYLSLIDLDFLPFDKYPCPPKTQVFSVNGAQQISHQPELVPA